MPRFNVGDRVRCINPGQGNRLELEEYEVLAIEGDFIQVVQGWWVFDNRFELIEAAPEREEHVGYYVVYQDRINGTLIPAAFPTEREADLDIADVEDEHNWTVVAKKKIKTRI